MGLDPTKRGALGDKWKEIAKVEDEAFFQAQDAYIDRTHYTEVKKYLMKQTGLDINMQPAAIQDAVWSASVQHVGARYFLVKAIKSLGDIDRFHSAYAPALINAIYDKRITYVSGVKDLSLNIRSNLINKRYPDEKQRALDMLR